MLVKVSGLLSMTEYYTPEQKEEIITEIFDRIAVGESIADICREEGKPTASNFYIWKDSKPEWKERYARARELQAVHYVDKINKIARNCPAVSDEVQKARLEIDTLKWTASKMGPLRFGNTVQEHKHDATVKVVIQDFANESD